ncbi:MAG TPA: hypothetical protein VMU35_07130 [Methylomirabilota bacterium]|nr:hypothetical protein [Methylomirabilota bacterium]
MTNSSVKGILIIFLASALLIALTGPTLGYASTENFTFLRTPPTYNTQTGAFTMSTQLTNDINDFGRSGTCVMFDYFIFGATAGQTFQGQAQSQGKEVFYMILQSPNGLYRFENSNCGHGDWESVEGFASQITITWVAPENGPFVIIFLTHHFYSGTILFTLQAT